MNLQIDDVGPDIVNVSWNAEEYLKQRVHQVSLVVEHPGDPSPVTIAIVNSSLSKASISTNLIPSTNYLIYIMDISQTIKLSAVQNVTTTKGGQLDGI